MSRTVCPNCQGRSLSFIDQRQADGSWAPGEGQRCDNCKAAFLPVTNESTEQGVREARQRLSEREQMADAQKGCVPCKLCGGSAIITDAGPGSGYYIACRKSQPFRESEGCIINERRLGGWAYNVMDWWNRLHTTATLSPDDIRREEARLTPEKVSNAALLGRFGHHPDPAIDFEIEVQAIVAVHADLAAGLREDERSGFADRIARAMTFRAGGDPISVAAKQTLREVEDASRKPANKPCLMFGYKCFCAPKDRPSCVHYSDDYDYNAAIRSQPSREGEK